jgi:hypothetical protein
MQRGYRSNFCVCSMADALVLPRTLPIALQAASAPAFLYDCRTAPLRRVANFMSLYEGKIRGEPQVASAFSLPGEWFSEAPPEFYSRPLVCRGRATQIGRRAT